MKLLSTRIKWLPVSNLVCHGAITSCQHFILFRSKCEFILICVDFLTALLANMFAYFFMEFCEFNVSHGVFSFKMELSVNSLLHLIYIEKIATTWSLLWIT